MDLLPYLLIFLSTKELTPEAIIINWIITRLVMIYKSIFSLHSLLISGIACLIQFLSLNAFKVRLDKFWQHQQLRLGGNCYHSYSDSFLGNLSVKEFWKLVNICRIYDQKTKWLFFFGTLCINKITDLQHCTSWCHEDLLCNRAVLLDDTKTNLNGFWNC